MTIRRRWLAIAQSKAREEDLEKGAGGSGGSCNANNAALRSRSRTGVASGARAGGARPEGCNKGARGIGARASPTQRAELG